MSVLNEQSAEPYHLGPQDATTPRLLPRFVRYRDLVAAGIVANWPTLLRLIAEDGFPPGVMLGRNTRAFPLDEIEAWLRSRPTARKILPLGARGRGRRGTAEPEAAILPEI